MELEVRGTMNVFPMTMAVLSSVRLKEPVMFVTFVGTKSVFEVYAALSTCPIGKRMDIEVCHDLR